MMYSNLQNWIPQKLLYSENSISKNYNLDLIDNGFYQTDKFIFFRKGEEITVYDRICDHSGGKLSLNGNIASCPLHGWELDLRSGQYLNVKCSKKPTLVLHAHELDSPMVEIPVIEQSLKLREHTNKYELHIEFINHACLYFEIPSKLRFATDPWVIGSAFNNGWWLKFPSRHDVFDILNNCDFIYISHNHPDHLHIPSLQHLRKDMIILTPKFLSGSTRELLEKEGFNNIVEMDFKTRLNHPEEEFSISVLKSGDFRDDSGLLVELGKFSCLLNVDSNFLNFGKLPNSLDLLCSSFAGGASGFPLCFETYSEEEKTKVVSRNRRAVTLANKKLMKQTDPTYFMPYAGFFIEKAKRDSYILNNNIKNSLTDCSLMCKEEKVEFLNIQEATIFNFFGKRLVSKYKSNVDFYVDLSPTEYINNTFQQANVLSDNSISNYFQRSGFSDSLVVEIKLTSDDFQDIKRSFLIDFSHPKEINVVCSNANKDSQYIEKFVNDNRLLQIKVREFEFYDVLKNGRPWEDLAIGFQCRINRNPNVYNSDFWFHFTNVYIGRKVIL